MLLDVEWSILRWTVLHRAVVIAVLILGAVLQSPFDSSAWIQLRLDATSTPLSTLFALPFLRWDTLHFLAMASPRPLPLPASTSYAGQLPIQARGGGTQSEQSLAFQPAIVWLLRISGSKGMDSLAWSPSHAVLLASTLAALMSAFLPLMLFRLSKKLTGNVHFSQAAAYLSILSPSPSTLVSPTPETFFSFFALLGHLCISSFQNRNQLYRLWTASLCYAVATAFRANGIFFVGFIIWEIFWQPPSGVVSRLSALFAPALAITCMMPFLLSQGFAYLRFCSSKVTMRDWCDKPLPSVYAFVQEHYWDVGLFRYWTLSQLPNWILTSPILGLALYWLLSFYSSNAASTIRKTFLPWRRPSKTGSDTTLIAHSHFTFFTFLILVLNSHVQIAFRFASPGGLPAVWWGASHLLLRPKSQRKDWLGGVDWSAVIVAYLVFWNLSSVIIYSGFYPPA